MISFIFLLSIFEHYCFYSENACATHIFHCGKHELMLLSNYLVCAIGTMLSNSVINTIYKREEIELSIFVSCFQTAMKILL